MLITVSSQSEEQIKATENLKIILLEGQSKDIFFY